MNSISIFEYTIHKQLERHIKISLFNVLTIIKTKCPQHFICTKY